MTYVGLPASTQSAQLDAAVAAVAALTDAGSGPGYLYVYTGTAPVTPGGATLETLLLTFTLADPAFGAASGGTVTLDVTTPPTAAGAASGTAGWARLCDASGAVVLDGDVATADAAFVLNSTAVVAGGTVTLTGGTLTQHAA